MQPVIGLTSRAILLRAAGQERPVETVARAYVDALEAEGALVFLLPSPAAPERAEEYAARLDGVLLTGGDDPHPHLFGEEAHPAIERVDSRRDRFEIALVRAARRRALPLFGVCRGVQLLNIALGGDIYQDIGDQTDGSICHSQRTLGDEAWHMVEVAGESRLAGHLGTRRIPVNSFHHQACRRPGEGLVVSATATDGIVEALEDPAHPFFLGVQWHPEIGPDAASRSLFSAFVQAARDADGASSKN